jgi:hypothetical protein
MVKMDKCGACKAMKEMFTSLQSSGRLGAMPYEMSISDAMSNPKYKQLVNAGYRYFPGHEGSVPLLMLVRRGRLRNKADVQLGTFATADQLEAFLKRL